MSKYINPYTDFGFKKLFGTEANKDLLIDFLNELVDKKHKIKDLSFKNNENLGQLSEDRKAIFDIYCETVSGEKIIIEMQKAKINYFKDRAVFYTTFPIKEQAEKGEWDFNLKPVYCIAILDFEFDKELKNKDYKNIVTLKNQYCEEFYDKLKYIFIEMPRFKKKENELDNHFEKWLYFLKNLIEFENIPGVLKEAVFEKGFKVAEIAALNKEQHEAYEKSLIQYWDIKSAVDTAFDDGKIEGNIEGKIEGKAETASIMISEGFDFETISRLTKLSIDEIKKIAEK